MLPSSSRKVLAEVMPFQVWVLCEREGIQRVKQLLEARGHLSKTTKVKSGATTGENSHYEISGVVIGGLDLEKHSIDFQQVAC